MISTLKDFVCEMAAEKDADIRYTQAGVIIKLLDKLNFQVPHTEPWPDDDAGWFDLARKDSK